jgi:lipid-binding SYLF domain-containing protein
LNVAGFNPWRTGLTPRAETENETETKQRRNMKQNIRYMAFAAFAAVLSLCAARAAEEDLRTESQQAISDFKRADSTLNTFFDKSSGYAVFPGVGKGGFIVGGARGKGLVYATNSVIGQATMTQASIGAQAGGQSFAEVIFFETPGALADFTTGKFEMSAEVSAVVAAEGASKAAKYKNGVAVFTLPKKGAMVQASIGGQKFKFEPEPLQPTGRPTEKKTN